MFEPKVNVYMVFNCQLAQAVFYSYRYCICILLAILLTGCDSNHYDEDMTWLHVTMQANVKGLGYEHKLQFIKTDVFISV